MQHRLQMQERCTLRDSWLEGCQRNATIQRPTPLSENVGPCFTSSLKTTTKASPGVNADLTIAAAGAARLLAAAAGLVAALVHIIRLALLACAALLRGVLLLACAALLGGILIAAGTAAGTLSLL